MEPLSTLKDVRVIEISLYSKVCEEEYVIQSLKIDLSWNFFLTSSEMNLRYDGDSLLEMLIIRIYYK